ncbi:sulfotransferase, partial [bacterium]|nr:sulfotransferase [bacterium]
IPNAKVVLVERDPIAVAWSIFRQFFATPGNGYSNDLDDIAEYLKLYRQLSSFWEAEFGDRIYKLRYENLTENQEQETCSLLDYVGLDFEKQCLAFQNNKRAVQTASNAQVRKGLYKGSSKVWKNYEPYLSCWIEKHVEIFS